MIKRIIVEGADQQGKSTFCKKLSEYLGWPVVHYGKPERNFDFYTGYVTNSNTISDRNFLSEVVYSKIRKEPCRANINIEGLLKAFSTLVIVLDREEHFKFDATRHEDFMVFEIIDAIELYREEFKKLDMNKMLLNPNTYNEEKTFELIKSIINGNI